VYSVSRLTKQVPVLTLPSSRVARYFDISKLKTSTKKQKAVELATRITSHDSAITTPLGERVKLSNELLNYFRQEPKKDDLSDCLLQAIAVLDWCTIHDEIY